MRIRRAAIIGAMIAGLMLSGCGSLNSAQDDGWNLIVAKDYQAARTHYLSKLVENPNDPYVNLNLGVTYEELGDTDLAVTHYQLAIANGKDAKIQEVAQDGKVVLRSTTVSEIAEENLAALES
jgi:tetratricopeptide (TPR) repeat protein